MLVGPPHLAHCLLLLSSAMRNSLTPKHRDFFLNPPAPSQARRRVGLYQLCWQRRFHLDTLYVPDPGCAILPACHRLLHRTAMLGGVLRPHAADAPQKAERPAREAGRRGRRAHRGGPEEAAADGRGRGCDGGGGTEPPEGLQVYHLRRLVLGLLCGSVLGGDTGGRGVPLGFVVTDWRVNSVRPE